MSSEHIILAGGSGMRYRAAHGEKHKALHQLKSGETLLTKKIREVARIAEIVGGMVNVVTYGPMLENIKESGIYDITVIDCGEPTPSPVITLSYAATQVFEARDYVYIYDVDVGFKDTHAVGDALTTSIRNGEFGILTTPASIPQYADAPLTHVYESEAVHLMNLKRVRISVLVGVYKLRASQISRLVGETILELVAYHRFKPKPLHVARAAIDTHPEFESAV